MTTDQTPEVPRRLRTNPYGTTPESGPAWKAAWDHLANGPAERTEVIRVMQKASPISWRTARDLLIFAVHNKTLEVHERDRYGRPTLKRPT